MHAAFNQFAAFSQDAKDNQELLARGGKLTMPILAVGGEKSFGTTMADVMRFTASDVQSQVIADAGHWIMEEQPAAMVKVARTFLAARSP